MKSSLIIMKTQTMGDNINLSEAIQKSAANPPCSGSLQSHCYITIGIHHDTDIQPHSND